MDEFRRKPVNRLAQPQVVKQPQPTPRPESQPASYPTSQPLPVTGKPEAPESRGVFPSEKPRKKKWPRVVLWVAVGIVTLAVAATGGAWAWYQAQLSPVDESRTEKVRIEIVSGSSPAQIADTLKEHDLIRNQSAFLWYTRFTKTQNNLQAGVYRLSPSESTPEIVAHLQNGKVDTFNITFLPGATLADNKKAFLNAGYTEAEVVAGFAASYTSPLFAGKPAAADLEGYIYGETYTFGVGVTVQDILTHVFDTYYGVIQEYDLEARFAQQGLTLFEGITLASIIQREAIGGDEPQIAQVFFLRLSIGMPLGSDVTYQYIADKLGVPRDVNLDSPYNTRRYGGLPPGPIAVPGVNALKAVGSPAEGDYLYFLSGDDDVTYFARDFQGHQANIVNHCKVKCQII